MTLANGTRLGPYAILAPIGAGGMGEVYRARDERLGREVAIKVLPASFSSDPDRLRRFEQEARAAGILNHPNITAVYDVGRHDGAPYVVQELLEGETLRSELSRGRLTSKRALDYAGQLARGLAAAHEKRIVHRDLKPENVFVTTDGRVKILDFGLAKLAQPERDADTETSAPTASPGTEPGVIMGSVGYMSPEQVKGKPADHRSDVFSFGTVLYEMLTGRPAFRGDSPVETMSAILNEEPPDLAQAGGSPALERLVRHCLEKVPERRFQSASDIAFDLETLTGVSSPEPLPATRSRVSKLRAAPPAAVVVAALAAMLGAYVLGRSRARPADVPTSYRQLTFRHGSVTAARFAPDGQTIAFSAAWDGGPPKLYTTRLDFLESRSLGYTDASLLSISTQGEIAAILSGQMEMHLQVLGTLSELPLSGGGPREVLTDVRLADWIPGGKDLAVVRRSGNKERLEFPAGHVVYETQGWIGWPRVSPAGDRVAFFDHEFWPDDRGSVAVVDLAGPKSVLSSDWETEEGLAWSAGGREIWFSAAKGGTALDLNAVTLDRRQRLVARVPGGLVVHDIFRDGRMLVSRDSIRDSLLSGGETGERDLSWLDWSIPVDFSPDGKTIVFSEQGLESGPHYSACLRKTDGSPVVRLGEGFPFALSPDGKWVVSNIPTSPNQLVLLPTGPGEVRKLARGPISAYAGGSFFPDGRRLLLAGEGAGGAGLYIQEIPDGQPRRIGDGVFSFSNPISPDGKSLAVYDKEHRLVVVSAEGGAGSALPGFVEGDDLLRWSLDGGIFVAHGDVPARIFRIDVITGTRTLWKTLVPADPAGVDSLRPIAITPDGRSYAFGCSRVLSDLFLAEGLK